MFGGGQTYYCFLAGCYDWVKRCLTTHVVLIRLVSCLSFSQKNRLSAVCQLFVSCCCTGSSQKNRLSAVCQLFVSCLSVVCQLFVSCCCTGSFSLGILPLPLGPEDNMFGKTCHVSQSY